ncbi:MAG: enoyl-CoA hydratase-related protein [Acidimicrobiales bacterium]
MALVELAVDGAVATVTLADVARRNVLSATLIAELHACLDAAEADDAVRVVVVTNRGGVFCAGADLASAGGAPVDLGRLLARIQRSPKPFVGRLAGHCVAGGVGLAAAMDLSVALDTATFGFTEVRLGVAPAIISVVCLPKMRRGDALDAFLRGRRFPASQAAALGLVNAVAPAEQLDAAVDAVVADLLAAHPDALAAAKRLVYDVPLMTRDEAYAWTRELSARLFASEGAREGMTAYLDKRPPAWVPPTTPDAP